jgi:hypothetical protein
MSEFKFLRGYPSKNWWQPALNGQGRVTFLPHPDSFRQMYMASFDPVEMTNPPIQSVGRFLRHPNDPERIIAVEYQPELDVETMRNRILECFKIPREYFGREENERF